MRVRAEKVEGFTLVELLVVIAVIAVLIALLLPALSKARAASVKLNCAARMRQLAQASMLYVNTYRGYLPPLAVGGTDAKASNSAGDLQPSGNSLGRPTIFPQGAASVPVNPSLLNEFLALNSVTLFVCPQFESQTGYNPNYSYSYRYNSLLGGCDPKRWLDNTPTTGNAVYVPWKIAQLSDTSHMALFIEGSLQNSGSPTENIMGFDRDFNAVSNGINYQTIKAVDTASYYLHSAVNMGNYQNGGYGIATGWQGDENIAFCDGSVSSIHIKLNSYPFAAWPDVYLDPYHEENEW